MNIIYDCHIHSNYSDDSDTPAEDMINKALELGLKGLIFTEHMDPDAPPGEEGFLFDLDTAAYMERLKELREQYSDKLDISIGVEIGMQHQVMDAVNAYAVSWPFDFIIASQHYLYHADPYYPVFFEGRDEKTCYQDYFIQELNNLRQFSNWDTLAHMDYIVRYGPTRNTRYSYHAYSDYIDPILRYIIEQDKCLEVNTGGFKYGLGQPNPDSTLLKRYLELGGEKITIGSDAHAPQHLAFDFSRAADLLRSLGFRYYTVFHQRKPEMLPL